MQQVYAVGYLRSRPFDHFFTWGIPLVGGLSLLLVLLRPEFFVHILLVDLSLLGYHHVISTYTRVNFSTDNALQSRWLFIYTPLIVICLVSLTLMVWGPIVITTLYLHWQWYHYTRQSEGIAKAYTFKSKTELAGSHFFNRFVFYSMPISTFLVMSSRQHPEFLWSDVYTMPIPSVLADALLFISITTALYWLVRQLVSVHKGSLSPLVLTYFVSHFCVYLFAYVIISDINKGWLLINIWHNLQYIAFVWVCNVNQYADPAKGASKFRQWLCAPENWLFYFIICFLISHVFYSGTEMAINLFPVEIAASLMIIVYQSINFHHYIVDACIWKLRKKSIRAAVGV